MEVGCLTIIDVKQNTAYTMGQTKTEEDVQKNIQGKQKFWHAHKIVNPAKKMACSIIFA
jgi:hypothetical protein